MYVYNIYIYIYIYIRDQRQLARGPGRRVGQRRVGLRVGDLQYRHYNISLFVFLYVFLCFSYFFFLYCCFLFYSIGTTIYATKPYGTVQMP